MDKLNKMLFWEAVAAAYPDKAIRRTRWVGEDRLHWVAGVLEMTTKEGASYPVWGVQEGDDWELYVPPPVITAKKYTLVDTSQDHYKVEIVSSAGSTGVPRTTVTIAYPDCEPWAERLRGQPAAQCVNTGNGFKIYLGDSVDTLYLDYADAQLVAWLLRLDTEHGLWPDEHSWRDLLPHGGGE